jgi:hypothetical protein
MEPPANFTGDLPESLSPYLEKALKLNETLMAAILDQSKAAQTYWLGLYRCVNDFTLPFLNALNAAIAAAREKLEHTPSQESLQNYLSLHLFNLQMMQTGLMGGMKTLNDYHVRQMDIAFRAWLNTAFGLEGENIGDLMARQAQLMDLVVHAYPNAIRAIKTEYGFHFDDGGYDLIAETDRFYLYQVLPRHKGVKVRKRGKPVVIIPPYVNGGHILACLPGEDKSYAHCFANQGIPTYIRFLKDIDITPAVQLLTGEDDCRDTQLFCEKVKERHGKPVTLCGYCQGGFTAVVNLLSGELDGLVDALITCVAPMDGTRSKAFRAFLDQLPESLKDLVFAMKRLPNGNQVVDGKLVSWVIKLKNILNENPITAFYRDIKMLEKGPGISKSAAAINHWLLYDVADMPLAICKMSYDSYTIPVAEDGTLPFRLFGRSLNFKRIEEKGIPWLICCAERDDLVEKEAALAPLDWVNAEVSIFPKGHVAIATSWSLPTSECSLDSCFLDFRGPVRYQLDLEKAMGRSRRSAPLTKRSRRSASSTQRSKRLIPFTKRVGPMTSSFKSQPGITRIKFSEGQ